MAIKFTKMNSQGNNFIVVDISKEDFSLTHENIIKICSQQDVDCDQLLLLDILNPLKVNCKIYNSDASPACQCGNGLRAIMLYLHERFSNDKTVIEVCNKNYAAHISSNKEISVDMGLPKYLNDMKWNQFSKNYIGGMIDVGNKHCVICVSTDEEIESILNDNLSLQSEYNFTFILNLDEIQNSKTLLPIQIKVKERGAGWTRSCGSGATAAAFVLKNLVTEISVKDKIMLSQEGGTLEVYQNAETGNFFLVGPSEIEYDGVWND